MAFQDHSIEFNMSSSNFSFICSYLIGHMNCSSSYLLWKESVYKYRPNLKLF